MVIPGRLYTAEIHRGLRITIELRDELHSRYLNVTQRNLRPVAHTVTLWRGVDGVGGHPRHCCDVSSTIRDAEKEANY